MKTNRFNSILISICCFLTLNSYCQTTDSFIGFWENDEKTITLEIYKSQNAYYGKLLKTTYKPEVRNLNENVMIQMVKKSNKVLYGGTYFDLAVNKSYEIKLRLLNNNTFYMKRFYKFFNKGYYWHRVTNL